jgi:hypothetical protein
LKRCASVDRSDRKAQPSSPESRFNEAQAGGSAAITGTPETYWRLERGKTKDPRLGLLVNCALALNVPLEGIAEEEWLTWPIFDVDAPAPEGRDRLMLGGSG